MIYGKPNIKSGKRKRRMKRGGNKENDESLFEIEFPREIKSVVDE